MNKRNLSYTTAILFIFLLMAPGIAAASGTYTDVSVCEAKNMIEEENVFILDVRTAAEFKAAHIEGATLIPLRNAPAMDPNKLPVEELLPARISEVPKDKPVVVYCFTGTRSLDASKLLAENEYTNVYNMNGGIKAWIDERYSVISIFVDESDLDDCIKCSLNAKVNRIFLHLEQGDDDKAKQEIDKFTFFVNNTEEVGRISTNQADYLRLEAGLIGKMI